MQLIITCEHGGNEVPAAYQHLFTGREDVLATHRGYDPGALRVAHRLSAELGVPVFAATVTRLLVELNRSRHHRSLFSEFSRGLSPDQKQAVLDGFYSPFRTEVQNTIAETIAGGTAVRHLSVHSFVATLNGQLRNADVGLLYDPARPAEVAWCTALAAAIRQHDPELRVRRNYPYLGKADGFTTHLRRLWPATRYAGVELELNQSQLADPAAAEHLTSVIVNAVRSTC